jgi:Sugar (and other) transporter
MAESVYSDGLIAEREGQLCENTSHVNASTIKAYQQDQVEDEVPRPCPASSEGDEHPLLLIDIDEAIGAYTPALYCAPPGRRSDSAVYQYLLSIPYCLIFPAHHVSTERLGMGQFQRTILWAAGLCFASDAMEILLLTFLAVVLQSQWPNVSDTDVALLTSCVFIGAMIGTLALGPLGDRIGRKPVFTLTAAIICTFGFLTAAVHNFTALLIVRFMVGFGVGGLTVPL